METATKKMILSKADEIQLLEVLRNGVGYFANEFTQEDILIMQENIRKDFPLLMETSIGNLKDNLEGMRHLVKQQGELIDSLKTKNEDVNTREAMVIANMKAMAVKILSDDSDSHAVYSSYPLSEVLKMKIENHISLNDADREYIVNSL